MKKLLAGMMTAAMWCACIQHGLAMGEVTAVTKQTQAELGLTFTLVGDRVDDEAVLVRMEVSKEGKLKRLRSVRMRIGPGRPLVAATLQTTPGKDGSWVGSFQLCPELADKCCIDLIVPSDPLSYEVYAVELKGYVTTRG